MQQAGENGWYFDAVINRHCSSKAHFSWGDIYKHLFASEQNTGTTKVQLAEPVHFTGFYLEAEITQSTASPKAQPSLGDSL